MTTPADAAVEHVAAFNEAVATGRWETFSQRFAADARMDFVGVPAGPFEGREAIAAAYAADPPREGVDPTGPATEEDGAVVVPFRWRESGGTGSMRLERAGDGLVQRLVVAFDQVLEN